MAITLRDKYMTFFEGLSKASKAAAKIDETCIYQTANMQTRKYMDFLLKENILPESSLGNIENIKEFYDAITQEKKSGVIMLEHYSNTDLPTFLYLLETSEYDWAKDMAKRIVAIAGMKLNEANEGVRAFTEGFTRVVIYPTRSLLSLKEKGVSDEEYEQEEKRARKINFAAMRAMDTCKKRGEIILVFPSGTRYRPGQPETKKGLREIDSYLRLFDVMLPVSINGACLKINPESPDDMLSDIVEPSVVKMTASKMIYCKPFRNKILEKVPADCLDPKQLTVDAVMNLMEEQHNKVENQ